MRINFSTALTDAWGKPIIVREGSEESYCLGDAVVDALNFPGKGQKERNEEDKRRRWKLVLRLTRPPVAVEEQAKYPTIAVGSGADQLAPADLTLMQQALHERFDSPMVYAQCWELLANGTDAG